MEIPPGMLEWIQEKVNSGEIQLQKPEDPPEEGAGGRFAALSEDTRELWMGSRQDWVNGDGKTFLQVLHDEHNTTKHNMSRKEILASIDPADFHAPEGD